MYPVPYASPGEAVELALDAERLGFDSVWANDHVNTPKYVREGFGEPPRFYEPYSYLSFVAARTTRLRLATAITVMSFRHPAMLAKQVATLDQLSGGRFILGLGIGAYRQESEVIWPGSTLHRGRHAEEFLPAIQSLLSERRSSFSGEYFTFEDVESYPKAVNGSVPLLSGGNSVASRERAARYASGWLPAGLLPEELRDGLDHIAQVAEQHGRALEADFDVAPQFTVRLGRTTEHAVREFEGTQLRAHDVSLAQSTLKDQQGDWRARDLIGSPEEVIDRIGRYEQAGVTTLAGLLFAADDLPQTQEQMQWFSEAVMPAFPQAESS
jgi:probable F420-dependent oxidoreductase